MADQDAEKGETPVAEDNVVLASNGAATASPAGVRTQSGGGAIVSDEDAADV